MWITNRRDIMLSDYAEMQTDASKEREAQDLLSTINNLSNSIKAYEGIIGGLHNPEFMQRKSDMESNVRNGSKGLNYWADLENEYSKLNPHAWATNLLGPSALRGNALLMMHEIIKYKNQVDIDETSEEDLKETQGNLINLHKKIDVETDKKMLTVLLEELKSEIYPGDNTLVRLLSRSTLSQYVDNLFTNSDVLNPDTDFNKFLSKTKNIKKSKDPFIKSAEILVSRNAEANEAFGKSSPLRQSLETKIANQAFNVFGTSLPPDATFTLRISDGKVKSYDYNGTTAPIMTTYFGLYNRHYSNNREFPWSLPENGQILQWNC